MIRKVPIKRKTIEVDIKGNFNIDGGGKTKISTGIEPLDHLLTVFAFHGLFDLDIQAKGDLQHHIVEDIGIAIGKAFKEALGDKKGINRYGCFTIVMDKVAVEVAVDISGRPSLHREIAAADKISVEKILANESFDSTAFTFKHAEEFLETLIQHAGISVVYIIKSAQGDLHHILEALFKALGKSLIEAVGIEPRRKGVPSTKGVID